MILRDNGYQAPICPWCTLPVQQFSPKEIDLPDIYHKGCFRNKQERLGIIDWFAEFKRDWQIWVAQHKWVYNNPEDRV